MTLVENVVRVQDVLKRLMKEKGLVYSDAAAHLGVSLATVKRLLTRDDISLSQLSSFAEWLGLGLRELINITFEEKPAAGSVTPVQEEFLAANPNFCAYLGALMEGHSVDLIQKKYGLTPRSTQRYLLGLDKAKLIELGANNRVRLLVDRFLSMRDLPKLRQVFYSHLLDVARDHFKEKIVSPGDAALKPVMLRLSKATYQRLVDELQALYDKYLVAMTYETKLEAPKDLLDVTLIMLADTWMHPSFRDVISNI